MGASIPGSAAAQWVDESSWRFVCRDTGYSDFEGDLSGENYWDRGAIEIDLDPNRNSLTVWDNDSRRGAECYLWNDA